MSFADCVHSRRLRTLPDLLDEIRGNAAAYDAVVLSHALQRLAKEFRKESQHGAAAGSLRELVLPALSALCEQLPKLISEFDSWAVAVFLWGLSVLNCYDNAVFNLLCQRGCQIARSEDHQMRPGDCAMIMLAFGRFGHYHPELLRCIPQVWYDGKKRVDRIPCMYFHASVQSGLPLPRSC